MAASGLDQTASAALVTAYCRPRPSDTLTRKCCRPNEYFDTAVRDCRSMSANTSGDRGSPVHEFLRDGARTAPIHVSTGKLTCGCGSPKSVSADEAFLGAADQLCDQKTGYCYSTSRYCLEYVWEEGVTSMTAIALVCPLDFFQKCCPRDYVLTDSGCALAAWGDVTARMVQLMELMEPQFWHPTDIGGQECVQEWITLDDASTHWWVNRSGCLSVDTELGSLTASSYCVDNYVSPASETQTGAFVCHKEQKSIKYPSAQHDAEGSVGKCCPHDSYMRMDDFSCVPDDLGLTLLENPILQTANVTRLTYNSFPTCENDFGYHYYFLDPDSQEDHAELVANQGIEVVSVEGKCILNRQPFLRKDYCLESAVTGGENRPMILVCAKTVATGITHTEKFGLTAALLGVSCVALFATTFFLVSSRLRRSSVSVNKVHTSMDWILLTYVVACLIAFLLLAVSMLWRISMDAIECQVMAGLLMFSLLGSFFWNTTICLETLLLTLGATTSRGWRRYVYHSLWAWGIPALITFLALTLDHYRENLPCSVITPRIGVYTCFFSDATAKLVYLYLPMLVSVCVNIVLLIAARCIRSAKLRRFGKSCRLGPPVGRDGSEARRPTLQNRFNKDHDYRTSHWRSYNSWTDSMKLVVWSGATWVMEVVGFVVSTYSVEPWESWDSYLWYIPSSINALRGVGIFFILVLTPENCLKLLHAFASLGSPRRDVGRHQNTSSSPGTRDGRGMSHTPRRHALTFHTYVSTATLESEGVEMDAGVEGACETGQSSTRETREGGGPSDISLPHSVPVYNTRSVSEA
ncbi:uncharacterized protein [Panulirus ornatus]|uniref:uncharacterized protein n=1 Tax=Panulirus ornatus TaxID=150431 RepID=UPI003A8419F2